MLARANEAGLSVTRLRLLSNHPCGRIGADLSTLAMPVCWVGFLTIMGGKPPVDEIRVNPMHTIGLRREREGVEVVKGQYLLGFSLKQTSCRT